MARERLLFLDEDLDKRLARELRLRRRMAETIYRTDLQGSGDGPLLDALNDRFGEDVVLVTGNDNMPIENGSDFTVGRVALATVDGQYPDGYHLDEWRREVVHRWAHAMQVQEPGTTKRYGSGNPRPWTLRPQKRLWSPGPAVRLAERYGRSQDA